MNYIVYKTTNKVNGKIYIGAHKTKNLDDGYLGSGLHLKRAIEKYGIEHFEKEILAVFEKSSEMFDMESELVNENFLKRDDIYNLKLGGEGGFDWINENCGSQGKRLNESMSNKKRQEGLKKQGWLRKNDSEWVNKRTEKHRDSKKIYFQTHEGTFKGKTHTDETKRKIGEASSKRESGKGNSNYGMFWICNHELKLNKKIRKDDMIPEGWVMGNKKTYFKNNK